MLHSKSNLHLCTEKYQTNQKISGTYLVVTEFKLVLWSIIMFKIHCVHHTISEPKF